LFSLELFSQIPFSGPDTDGTIFDPDELWVQLELNEKEMQQGLARGLFSQRARQNLTMVYKVQVTPTRILLNGPEPEAKNRILRKFSRHTGYFARIQFCDEDGQDLFLNPKGELILQDPVFSYFFPSLAQLIRQSFYLHACDIEYCGLTFQSMSYGNNVYLVSHPLTDGTMISTDRRR
jgi:hypothetical protein